MIETSRRRLGRLAIAALALAGIWVAGQPSPASATLQSWNATVTRVVDGDTMYVRYEGDSAETEIRIAGVQTNELGECFSSEPTTRLTQLIDGRSVTLRAQDENSTSLGRDIRHVFLGDQNIATQMLREGYGVPVVFRNERDFGVEYANAALLAADDGIGIWDDDRCGAGPFATADIDMIVNYDAAFDDNTNVNGEYVQLRNRGSERITLDGWLLRDTALRRFPLPSGYRIDPGDYVRIFVGVGTNGPRSIYLGQSSPLFGNDTDGVFLHDPDFDLRAFDIWPCTDTCVDPPQLTIDTVNANAPGDDNTNPNGEWVRIRNTGGVTVDFQDWMVDFPRFQITSIASRPLAPNETLTIFMGTGTNTGNEMYLGETDPTSAVLSNTNHIVVLYTPERTVADCDAAGTSVCPTILDVEDPDAMKSAVRIGNARRV